MSPKKNAVVFGGSGFLGSYVADELSLRGLRVTIADLVPPTEQKFNQKYNKIDICDAALISSVTSEADYVFNFISLANLDEAIQNPKQSAELNIMGNISVLEALKSQKVKKFVFASSAYATNNEGSFYGITKRSAEQITREYGKRYSINYTIIRYGSVYGEKPSKNNYLYNLIKNAIVNGAIKYKGLDSDVREYIHAADAARLSVDMLDQKEYDNSTINLSGLERITRAELIRMIQETLGGDLSIKQTSTVNTGHYKVSPYSYNSEVAKKLIANPFIDLGQGILQCIEHIKDNHENESS